MEATTIERDTREADIAAIHQARGDRHATCTTPIDETLRHVVEAATRPKAAA